MRKEREGGGGVGLPLLIRKSKALNFEKVEKNKKKVLIAIANNK
jgi:hypothetical protein